MVKYKESDAKDLAAKLCAYFEGKDLKCGDALRAAEAIATLLAERDAAVAMLKAIKDVIEQP